MNTMTRATALACLGLCWLACGGESGTGVDDVGTPDDDTSLDDGSGDTPAAPPPYVDVHLHVGALAEAHSAETNAEAAEVLVDILDGLGVELGLVVVVPATGGPPVDELALAKAGVAAAPDRLKLLAGGATLEPYLQGTAPDDVTDALRAQFVAAATGLLDDHGAVGFGEMLSLHVCLGPTHSYQHVPADHPLYLELADIAAARGVAMDLHMEAVPEATPMPGNLLEICDENPDTLPPSVPQLKTLLDHNPEARVVWQHIGWDNIGTMTPALIEELIDAHDNLYLALRVEERDNQVKLPGVAMPNRLVDSDGVIDPDWLQLITDHPDRFVIGSDEFVSPDGSPTTGIESLENTWAMLSQLPADVQPLVGGANAAQIYGLAAASQ